MKKETKKLLLQLVLLMILQSQMYLGFFYCFCVTAPLLSSLTNENNACKRCVVVRSTTSGCSRFFWFHFFPCKSCEGEKRRRLESQAPSWWAGQRSRLSLRYTSSAFYATSVCCTSACVHLSCSNFHSTKSHSPLLICTHFTHSLQGQSWQH